MLMRSLYGGTVAATALLSSVAALAAPITTIDGISIPVGTLPGGIYLSSENSFENVITAPGQIFTGVFKVADIVDQSTAHTTYSYGQNGAFLTGIFDNFIADQVIAPTPTSAGKITFFGGEGKYCVESSDVFTITSGQAIDLATDCSGTLWLRATPAAIDAAGHTLTITIPANNGLGSFSNATATTFLDVVGGDAAPYFNTNTFVNPFSLIGNDDILFQGTADSGSPNDFPISGTNAIKANVALAQVPEPFSLSLFGAGLIGLGAFVGRRKIRGT